MKTVGIFSNIDKPEAMAEMAKLKSWFIDKNCKVLELPPNIRKIRPMDFVITLGGDGTMLKASRILAPASIPILGVNLGSLGFLAETNVEETLSFLEKILAGNFQIEERAMLSIELKYRGKTIVQNALNDCILRSGNNGRVITISVFMDNEYVGDYVGDGLIVATPTGSTAYSLAASGPIVNPNLSVFVLTPICPHTLTQRPLIMSTKHIFKLMVDSSSMKKNPVVLIDGQINYVLSNKDSVTISSSETPLKLIINPKRKYLQVLRTKLKWGERG